MVTIPVDELLSIMESDRKKCIPGGSNINDPMYRVGYRDALNNLKEFLEDYVSYKESLLTDRKSTINNNPVTSGYLNKIDD